MLDGGVVLILFGSLSGEVRGSSDESPAERVRLALLCAKRSCFSCFLSFFNCLFDNFVVSVEEASEEGLTGSFEGFFDFPLSPFPFGFEGSFEFNFDFPFSSLPPLSLPLASTDQHLVSPDFEPLGFPAGATAETLDFAAGTESLHFFNKF